MCCISVAPLPEYRKKEVVDRLHPVDGTQKSGSSECWHRHNSAHDYPCVLHWFNCLILLDPPANRVCPPDQKLAAQSVTRGVLVSAWWYHRCRQLGFVSTVYYRPLTWFLWSVSFFLFRTGKAPPNRRKYSWQNALTGKTVTAKSSIVTANTLWSVRSPLIAQQQLAITRKNLLCCFSVLK